MTELTFLKELILMKQLYQKSKMFVKPNVCNKCHGLLMMYVKLRDIAILNIKDFD